MTDHAAPTPQPVLRDGVAIGAWLRRYGSATVALVVAVTIVRLVYLIWFSRYQLVGDESYYWEQARHLDWCYDEKGPALAWMVAACCRWFGDTEWAVRLPAVLAMALAAWGVGRLARAVALGDAERTDPISPPQAATPAQAANRARAASHAEFHAALLLCFIPAFEANAQICTQDAPITAVLVGLSAVGLRIFRRWRRGHNTSGEWLLFWWLMGAGFLLKQSILLFLPSVALMWALDRRRLRVSAVLVLQQLAGLAVFFILIAPMIAWNQRHGWPMLSHTLGHLAAEGDQARLVQKGNALTWLAATLGGIAGSFGPALLLLCGATWWAARDHSDPQRRADRLWLLMATWPSVLFYVALSLYKPVIPSWPLPSFVPLVAVAGELCAIELARYAAMLAAWRADARRKPAQPKPDTPFHRVWWVAMAYGIVAWWLLWFPAVIGQLPKIGPRLEKSVIGRFTGHREEAAEVASLLATLHTPDGRPPLIVTRHYMKAGLLAFYLPGHPTVYTAGKYLGKRSTTFDQWPDTRLDNPALYGRTLLLVGAGDVKWERGLIFDHRVRLWGENYFLAPGYQGPRPGYPGSDSDGPVSEQ